ncbi:DUF4241 domain-containing protein [Hymenobacter agri]
MKRFEIILYTMLTVVLLAACFWLRPAPPAAALAPLVPELPAIPDTARTRLHTSSTSTVAPRIFEAAFTPATTVFHGADTLNFRVNKLGKLLCESGTLMACDPINLHDSPGFAQRLPTGRFPVELAMAAFRNDERVAFSRVVFSRQAVAKWELARLPGQAPLALSDSTTYCYPVDAGAGIFADKAAATAFDAKGQAAWDAVFLTKATKNGYRGFIEEFNGHNLATFSTGLGDGCYSTYIGYDATGRVCRLLTDFGLVDWQLPRR